MVVASDIDAEGPRHCGMAGKLSQERRWMMSCLPEGGPLEEWTTLRLRYIGLAGQLVFFLVGESATGYLKCFCFIESYLKWLGLTEPP